MNGFPPTEETFVALQQAYTLFNEQLFGGDLPDCLITIQDQTSSSGYFIGDRFRSKRGKTLRDEIALNPELFGVRTDREVFATLAHEMVHLWQHHFGTPGKRGYHNREWAKKMEEIGLVPSTTGKRAGDRTGYRCSHYIPRTGPFAEANRALKTEGVRLRWAARPRGPGRGQTRERFMCPSCFAKAYARPNVHLICGTCRKTMEI